MNISNCVSNLIAYPAYVRVKVNMYKQYIVFKINLIAHAGLPHYTHRTSYVEHGAILS